MRREFKIKIKGKEIKIMKEISGMPEIYACCALPEANQGALKSTGQP